MNDTGPRGPDRLLLSTRLALGAGFGGLLAIMALAGIYGIRVLQQIRRNENQIRTQFLLKNHTLNDIRSQLHLSGTYVRDYLLEPEPGRAETYRANLEEVHRQMESALESFGRQLESGQTQYYTELSADLSNYWQILGPIFKWDRRQRRHEGYAFLRDEVFPRRAAVLAIAGRIAYINEQQLNAGNQRVDHLLSEFQSRLAMVLLATLPLGSGMAAFSMWKILGLEARAHAQYQEVVEARRQLEELSARLVHAQENERRVLARELHDEVGQALSAVLVELRNLSAESAIQTDEQSAGHVETVKSLVENSVRVVRNMALLLRPSMLDDLGLVPALQWQAREVVASRFPSLLWAWLPRPGGIMPWWASLRKSTRKPRRSPSGRRTERSTHSRMGVGRLYTASRVRQRRRILQGRKEAESLSTIRAREDARQQTISMCSVTML